MIRWPIPAAALAAILLVQSPLLAQIPGIPGIPGMGGAAGAAGAAGAVPGAAAPPAAPAAAPNNIWSKLCMTPDQAQACLQKICACPLVQFLQGALVPVSALSGGLISGCCPAINPLDLAKPADSAEGAASRIKKLEAEAKARRAACRYLGTVDCRRFPEAELALINSLRGDTNECVRIEAALALGNGCCCTKKVLEALVITVAGKKTNDPAETSLRVKAAAAYALERCLTRYCEIDPASLPAERPPEPGKPPAGETAPPPPAPPAAGAAAARLVPDALVEEGRRALASYKATYGRAPAQEARPATAEPPQAPAPAPPAETVLVLRPAGLAQAGPPGVVSEAAPPAGNPLLPPTGQRDVFNLLRHSMGGR
jgi:hypothetical protein